MSPRIAVYGLGYIGLPTASLLATKGFQVLGVDVDVNIVDTINSGEIHFFEPGLDILVKSAINSAHLKASIYPASADIHIITVPTPLEKDNQPDLSYIEAASKMVASVINENNLVILESTSPLGTTEKVAHWIQQYANKKVFFYTAYSPERVIPGKVLHELVENDRVVGGLDETSANRAKQFYESFISGQVYKTNARTAEMCKLTENAFRDVNIAFANELAMICDEQEINVWELISLANHHPRVDILQPGPGVGGHCIAVDPWFIIASAQDKAQLIHQARKVNDLKPQWVVNKVKAQAHKLTHPIIACFGLTFKANTDDLRGSPALKIVKELMAEVNGEILAVEPNISHYPALNLVDKDEALSKADIVIILVDHNEFKNLAKELNNHYVIDTKGLTTYVNKI
jgi:UDP-N-acetyl-D-mannosaminuronic acid dehydrogenase